MITVSQHRNFNDIHKKQKQKIASGFLVPTTPNCSGPHLQTFFDYNQTL